MISQKDTDATTAPRFKDREPVIGRRWGGEDLVSGYYVRRFGTDGDAVIVETLAGERIPLVGETVRTVESVMPAKPTDTPGRHHRIDVDDEPTAVIPKDLLPLPGDDEQTTAVAPVEWPEFEPVEGTLPETPIVKPTRGTRGTAFLALMWFRVVAFFGKVVDALAVRFENVGQDVIDHARVIAKVFFASLSTLVVAGAGIAWWLS